MNLELITHRMQKRSLEFLISQGCGKSNYADKVIITKELKSTKLLYPHNNAELSFRKIK